MKKIQRKRPSGLTTMSIIVLLGALFSAFLLLFAIPGSSDFYFLISDAVLGFITAYGLWTLQRWAFWFTAAYETYEIVYELFTLTQSAYWNIHIVLPLGGIIASAIGLAYIFLDPTVKPAFAHQS
jgi:hypothetical protein